MHKTDRILILLRLKDSEGLALLAIATITANCQQASSSCCDQHTATYDAVVVVVRRHSDERRWGGIHEQTLSPHEQ